MLLVNQKGHSITYLKRDSNTGVLNWISTCTVAPLTAPSCIVPIIYQKYLVLV